MNRTVLIAAIFSGLLLSTETLQAGERGAQAGKPNIVLMLADDLGWVDPGIHGGNPDLTPNIDAFAKQSMELTQFYSHSVCSPTRAALMTGRYAFRNWFDWRSEDFGKADYLERLGMKLETEAGARHPGRIL